MPGPAGARPRPPRGAGEALRRVVAGVEELVLRKALASGASQRGLAARLGMSRMTLRKKLKAHGIA